MTELPPILERLDEEWRNNPAARAVDCTHIQFMDAYPDLRALVLRLQEERDHARENWNTFADELSDMVSQRDALLEALKEIRDFGDKLGLATIPAIVNEAIANVEGKDG